MTMNLKIFFLLLPLYCCSQVYKDTLYGNPKYIHEYVVFLTEKQNPQFLYNSDYGHEGFLGNDFTKKKFKNVWFNNEWVYYINYEKFITYNKGKKTIKENWLLKDNSFLSGFSEKYDKRNRLIEKVLDSNNVHHFRKFEISYQLFNPKRIEKMILPLSKNEIRNEYYFNKHKKNKVSRFLNNKKGLDSIFIYDDKKKLIETSVLHKSKWKLTKENHLCFCPDSLGVKEVVYKFFYDSQDNLIAKENYKLDENNHNYIVSKEEMEYDENNLLILRKLYSRERKSNSNEFSLINHSQEIFEYQDNKLYKKSYYYKSKLQSWTEYSYEGDNIVTVKYFENNNLSLITFKYKFDHYQNWVEIVKNVNNKDLYIWKRDIEYY